MVSHRKSSAAICDKKIYVKIIQLSYTKGEIMTRIEKEKQTINLMINIYCRKKHKHKNGLCEDCQELLEYAHKRLDFCKFGNEKSFCSKCPIHCYKKDMKVKIKDVMKFSGPRLIIYSPMQFIKHIFE